MSDYLLQHGTRSTPQREQIRDDQVENSEGGFVWAVDKRTRLRRFLILGSEGGSFYATQRELTFQNVKCVRKCVEEDGLWTVREIVEVSRSGRAPNNDPALYALATAISLGDKATKSAAAEALPQVARIGTHLFHFMLYAKTMRGWGPTLRWAISNWLSAKDSDDFATEAIEMSADKLAYQAVKYRQRDSVAFRDLLRLAHPAGTLSHGANHVRAQRLPAPIRDVLGFISGNVGHEPTVDDRGRTGRKVSAWTPGENTPDVIEGYLAAQRSTSPEDTAGFVRVYGLPREALNPDHLNSREVWEALLEGGMPLTAMIRNLATMTRVGVLTGDHLNLVVAALGSEDALRKARVHPVSLLIALRTYASGHGYRGQNVWTPIMAVTDALDEAFYLAFQNVEPTGKRMLLGVDVSGSMNGYAGGVSGSPLTAREAAAAMALVTIHAEPSVDVVGFTNRMYRLSYSRRQRLDDALRATPSTGEGTDCGVPIAHALRNGGAYDAIVLYTDSETWAGTSHVSQAIGDYRNRTGLQTRLVACGMVANEFTVCDPKDPLSLNVVGFDAATPGLISEFAAGKI